MPDSNGPEIVLGIMVFREGDELACASRGELPHDIDPREVAAILYALADEVAQVQPRVPLHREN
jgi:hypothetical protein